MALVEFPGETRKACLAYLPHLSVGDYTLVHAGFALTKLDEESAMETLRIMRDFQVIEDAPATDGAR